MKRRTHDYDSSNHSHSDAAGRRPGVAVQSCLGLLPERHAHDHHRDSSAADAERPHLAAVAKGDAMSTLARVLLVALLAVSVASCAAIEGIFKAGVGVGIAVTIAIIVLLLIIWGLLRRQA